MFSWQKQHLTCLYRQKQQNWIESTNLNQIFRELLQLAPWNSLNIFLFSYFVRKSLNRLKSCELFFFVPAFSYFLLNDFLSALVNLLLYNSPSFIRRLATFSALEWREMTSSIFSHVRIWKIRHFGPVRNFAWILWVVYFPFSNSVIIRRVKTKKIGTVTELSS